MGIESIISETTQTWSAERPDLDFTVMGSALKAGALVRHVADQVEREIAPLGINVGEFDVLATLRRHGKGASLTPSEIARVTMISPSGLTNRLSRLEKMELISRDHDPADRRSALIKITAKGRKVVDRAIECVVAVEDRVFEDLSSSERDSLRKTLDVMIAKIDSDIEASIDAYSSVH